MMQVFNSSRVQAPDISPYANASRSQARMTVNLQTLTGGIHSKAEACAANKQNKTIQNFSNAKNTQTFQL